MVKVKVPWQTLKVTGRGQSHNNEQMAFFFYLVNYNTQTSYLVPKYNTLRNILWHQFSWPWRKARIIHQGQMSQKWRCLCSLNAFSVFDFSVFVKPILYWNFVQIWRRLVITSLRNRRGVIFHYILSVCVCVCVFVCVCACVCVCVCLCEYVCLSRSLATLSIKRGPLGYINPIQVNTRSELFRET